MKKLLLMVGGLFLLASCGYTQRQSELTGQVKRLTHETPILCPDRVDVDLSLGVMRNGVGSMSSEDVFLTVPNREDQEVLAKAAAEGALVKITYDTARFVFCWNPAIVTHVERTK